MPHVDEMLGPVTLAAAGLVVAIALQPVAGKSAPSAAAMPDAAVATIAPRDGRALVVRLPSVDVVGRRESASAGPGPRDGHARQRQASAPGVARPRA